MDKIEDERGMLPKEVSAFRSRDRKVVVRPWCDEMEESCRTGTVLYLNRRRWRKKTLKFVYVSISMASDKDCTVTVTQ